MARCQTFGLGSRKKSTLEGYRICNFCCRVKNWSQKKRNEKFFHLNPTFELCRVFEGIYGPARVSNLSTLEKKVIYQNMNFVVHLVNERGPKNILFIY